MAFSDYGYPCAMQPVWITSLAVAHPPYRLDQEEAAQRIGATTGELRRAVAIARGTQIEARAIALPPEDIGRLGSIEERNGVYRDLAPQIGLEAASTALDACVSRQGVSFLATSSCTGYMVPGLDVHLAASLGLAPSASRLPITEAGCAGGIVAIARVADYLRTHPGAAGLAIAVELCSLAFHSHSDIGNLTSALLFGDGAGAALLQSNGALSHGLEVIDTLSYLVPDSQDALGFDLTDRGFYPILTRELSDLLPGPTVLAVSELMARNGLTAAEDVSYWLIHPGGPRVLTGIQHAFGLDEHDLRWSWQSLREYGNTSSAAIFDVMRRFTEEPDAPYGWGLVIAFGPGVSIEIMLVRRC
jgi:alkylresorcinol/alkylpyrone synthase